MVAELAWLAYTPTAFVFIRLLHHVTFVPALVLLLTALTQSESSFVFSWLATRPMQYLGEISYCFYIVQIPMSFFFDVLIERGTLQHTSFLAFPVAFAINLIAADVLHRFVEKPAHAWLMQRYQRQKVALA